ncbi:MAG: response regulator, partial [Deltaproteobacteria bacterium]
GMDEKTRERIFEPFFTTKEAGKGTGLGLSIVYGIVKQHSGYINTYSEIGKGTAFKIYLPIIKMKEGEIKHEEPVVSVTGSETVLMAEDDATVRKLSKTLLETFGYKVIEAVDGEDAVEKFMENKDKIQLVILDVIMPKKNGKEAYDLIRKAESGVKTLFMSGYTADDTKRRGILEEGLDFVSKPISPSAFLKKVREVLDK